MSASDVVRWSALAALLGGVLWLIGTVIHASKPRGCIAEECAFRPMRETGALDGMLMLLSLLLFAVGAAGLVILIRGAGRFGEAGKTGAVIGVVGAALLMIAGPIKSPCRRVSARFGGLRIRLTQLTLRKAQVNQYGCPGDLHANRWSERKHAWADDARANSSLGKYNRPK